MLSQELRDALGMEEGDPPPYYRSMVVHGYPPGYYRDNSGLKRMTRAEPVSQNSSAPRRQQSGLHFVMEPGETGLG